jgi:hypothetical protein
MKSEQESERAKRGSQKEEEGYVWGGEGVGWRLQKGGEEVCPKFPRANRRVCG